MQCCRLGLKDREDEAGEQRGLGEKTGQYSEIKKRKEKREGRKEGS